MRLPWSGLHTWLPTALERRWWWWSSHNPSVHHMLMPHQVSFMFELNICLGIMVDFIMRHACVCVCVNIKKSNCLQCDFDIYVNQLFYFLTCAFPCGLKGSRESGYCGANPVTMALASRKVARAGAGQPPCRSPGRGSTGRVVGP